MNIDDKSKSWTGCLLLAHSGGARSRLCPRQSGDLWVHSLHHFYLQPELRRKLYFRPAPSPYSYCVALLHGHTLFCLYIY